MLKRFVIASCVAVLMSLGSSPAYAGPLTIDELPVSVSYTVSGVPGNWLLDFSVTSRFPADRYPDMGIHWWGVLLPQANQVVSAPAGWEGVPWTEGGHVFAHNNYWSSVWGYYGEYNPNLVMPGQTMDGFAARVSTEEAPASVPWFAWAVSQAGQLYYGPRSFGTPENPGFQSPDSPSLVPEPSSLVLLGSGIAALCGWRSRRRTKAAARVEAFGSRPGD